MKIRQLNFTAGGLALLTVCVLFAIAVYKIESDVNHQASISCVRAEYNDHQINAAHAAIREQATIQIIAARQAIVSIQHVLNAGTEPPALKGLYEQSIRRQHLVIARETRLRASVHAVKALC